MGALFKISLATNADGSGGSYDLPLDAFVKDFEKRKKTAVRRIPGKSGGIDTADKKLEPGTLELTFMIDDPSPTDLKTLRQALWVAFHTYMGKYVCVWDQQAGPAAVCDSWLYDDIDIFTESRVRRLQMKAARIRVGLSLNTQPYETGGDIPS